MRDNNEDDEIERAITFLVNSFETSGDNPKPVVLHSIRVAMDLYNRGYDSQIIIAALLHDLLEDTAVTKQEIQATFGTEVAGIVEATSFDTRIETERERYRDTFGRCFDVGRPAVIVKAADILDNSHYYHLAETAELQTILLDKMGYFIEKAEPFLQDEPLYFELREAFSRVKRRMVA